MSDLICELYEQHSGTLIAHMEVSGIAFPELIGIDWRLDYSIRSKHGGRKNTAMYFVVLKVKDRGLPREIQMMATYEDLQDMLAKVLLLHENQLMWILTRMCNIDTLTGERCSEAS